MQRLKALTEIQTANSMLRLVIACTLLSALAIVGFTFYKSQQTISEIRKSVYVPINGNSMEMMVSKNYKENREAEIRNHLKMFHELFFNLSPDEVQIKKNITRSLYLADKSVKDEYDRLSEEKYYSKLVGSNSFQYIQIDSMQVNQYSNPYQAIVFFKRTIVRPSIINVASIVTSCNLINITSGRTENNPHALLIEKWVVNERKDIENRSRN